MKKEKPVKEKRVPIKKIGTRRKSVILMWGVLLFSVAFAIYKNFTAVDTRTEVKETVIEQKISDTNAVEAFVKDFAKIFYTWNPTELATRSESLKGYLTDTLQKLNADMVRDDITTDAAVDEVKIWNVEQSNENWYEVTVSVLQHITEHSPAAEGQPVPDTPPAVPATFYTETTYIISVYRDDAGNMIIAKNPTVTAKPEKSSNEPKPAENDGTVSGETMQEINKFLETFYMLYPGATKDELTYYVSDEALKPINKNYLFAGLSNQTFRTKDDTVLVGVVVKYIDQDTKATQYMQYDLQLQKSHNWVVIGKGSE